MDRFLCSELVKQAIKAAIEAGEAIMEIYNQLDLEVELKANQTPVTRADTWANQIIEDGLKPTELPVLSEEGIEIPFDERKNWKRFWLVDPLDGTKEFIKKNDEFTVNIALIEKGNPLEGVIYVPVTRELFYTYQRKAYKGMADENGKVEDCVQLLNNKSNNQQFVVALSRSHTNQETKSYAKSINTRGKSLKFVQIGSSLKFCRIAEGQVDCYPKLGPTMEWDTAAGHAILNYTGKSVTQMNNGKPLVYNKKDLFNPWFMAQ